MASGINPFSAGNVGYLLWLLQGYLLVTAVLVISLGRLGDIVGRVRIYNLGFAVFTFGSVLLALDPYHGGTGALWLVLWRLVQGVGGAMLFANSSAILVDAFPSDQRGMAMGINQVAAIGGSFIGLIAGGLLSVVDWRLVFWVSVPFGIFGTIWGYFSLRDNGKRAAATHRLVGQPHLRGRTHVDPRRHRLRHPAVPAPLHGMDVAARPLGLRDRRRVPHRVLRHRDTAWSRRCSTCDSSRCAPSRRAARPGSWRRSRAVGLQFMLIIWLQGIWLPLHGYAYSATPLWAGIYLLPLTTGFLFAGPISGYLSDRHGARILSTSGHVGVRREFRRTAARCRRTSATGSSRSWSS